MSTVNIVQKLCSGQDFQCKSVVIAGKHVSIVTMCLSLLYFSMGLVIIYFIKIQERNARMGDSKAVVSVIFPVFVTFLWLNTFINIYIGVVILTEVYMTNAVVPAILFSIVFGLQHAVMEGIALVLMMKGLGWDGVRKVRGKIGSWTGFTVLVKFLQFFSNFSRSEWAPPGLEESATVLNVLWSLLLLSFYGILWLTPQKHLFRRPAAINYAKFWFTFRFFSLICEVVAILLPKSDHTLAYCVFEIFPYYSIAVLEPLVVYYTLLQDSRWWQGLDISQGKRIDSAEAIRAPLEGLDLDLQAAQHLAASLDFMQEEEVKLLNFAYITMDKKKTLGSGSFSKVYKGAYKSEPCAIKLIYTVDLTIDVIMRVASEAQILSRITHTNIVKIFGVSVLPPSVCILLEFCQFGSLQDVVKGTGIFTNTSAQISTAELYTDTVLLNVPESYTCSSNKGRNKLKSTWLDGTGFSFDGIKEQKAQSGELLAPSMSISTADRIFLALGCATGLSALHDYNSNLCHRDIKSFNFLVDSQLVVKLADLELGVSEDLSETGTINADRREFEEKSVSRSSSCNSLTSGNTSTSALKTSSTSRGSSFHITHNGKDDCTDVQDLSVDSIEAPDLSLDDNGHSSSVTAAGHGGGGKGTSHTLMEKVAADPHLLGGQALTADDFLANWAAPEVVQGKGHTQASDMYSCALVMWEIVSGVVPFSSTGPRYEPVRQDDVRKRILKNERPALPKLDNDAERTGGAALALPHNVISQASPFADYVKLIRQGWHAEPDNRFNSQKLYQNVIKLYQKLCHDLCMYVNNDINSVLRDYHVPYEIKSNVGISNIVKSPDSTKQQGSQGSQNADSSESPMHTKQIRRKSTEGTLPEEGEDLQSVLETISKDDVFDAFSKDGGAWVIISTQQPHYILHTTESFSRLMGLNSKYALGKSLEVELSGKNTDTYTFKRFLYELNLYNALQSSVYRSLAASKCTTTMLPSYYTGHAMLVLYSSNPFEDYNMFVRGSVDGQETINMDTVKEASRGSIGSISKNLSTGKMSSNSANKGTSPLHENGNSSFGTNGHEASDNRNFAEYSVHGFPLFNNKGGVKKSKDKDVTEDMKPVAFALLLSEFRVQNTYEELISVSKVAGDKILDFISQVVAGNPGQSNDHGPTNV